MKRELRIKVPCLVVMRSHNFLLRRFFTFDFRLGIKVPCLIRVREARIVRRCSEIGGRFENIRHDAAIKHDVL